MNYLDKLKLLNENVTDDDEFLKLVNLIDWGKEKESEFLVSLFGSSNES